jgi:hypothetical protein
MPSFTASVGEGAANKVHDVALAQVILRIIKDKKGLSYYAGSYDGVYSPATKIALAAFQADHSELIHLGQSGYEKAGFVAGNGLTLAIMTNELPVSHKAMHIIPGSKTVYIEGSQAAAKASVLAIRTDLQFEATFKNLLSRLVENMFETHRIVLQITPTGRRRTFAQRANETATHAGPGESNHNFGRASDIGFKGLRWLRGDGTIEIDSDWLNTLEKFDAGRANAFWDARDALALELPLFRLDFERVHLQPYDQATFSNINSLVKLLNTVGKLKWQAGYKSDFGLGTAFYPVGTAKQIWLGAAVVKAADLATALTAKEKINGSKKVFNENDIDSGSIIEIQQALKADFEAADKNWTQWVRVR